MKQKNRKKIWKNEKRVTRAKHVKEKNPAQLELMLLPDSTLRHAFRDIAAS